MALVVGKTVNISPPHLKVDTWQSKHDKISSFLKLLRGRSQRQIKPANLPRCSVVCGRKEYEN